jgi:hypothetical protein
MTVFQKLRCGECGEKSVEYREDFTKGRSPMLLVSVVGSHYFQVFGALWNGAKVCVDPLSDPVSLLFVRRDPRRGVSKVA